YWHEAVEFYTPDPADRRNPLASPGFAEDFTGLPPAIVLIAQYDPFRDEAHDYARKLRSAGVDVEVIIARNHAHATVHGGGRHFESAAGYRRQRAEALQARLTTRS